MNSLSIDLLQQPQGLIRPLADKNPNRTFALAKTQPIQISELVNMHNCEEPPGPAFGGPDDKLRDEAIHTFFLAACLDCFAEPVIGRAYRATPFARNDELTQGHPGMTAYPLFRNPAE